MRDPGFHVCSRNLGSSPALNGLCTVSATVSVTVSVLASVLFRKLVPASITHTDFGISFRTPDASKSASPFHAPSLPRSCSFRSRNDWTRTPTSSYPRSQLRARISCLCAPQWRGPRTVATRRRKERERGSFFPPANSSEHADFFFLSQIARSMPIFFSSRK